MTPILGSQAWPELRTAPPNPNTARYEDPGTSDHPNALRTRPSVTWNRFPLSEGQVVSPLLFPPPFSCHGNYGAGWGGGRETGPLSSWPGYPVCSAFTQFSPSLPFSRQGGGASSALSPACRGFTSKGHHLQSPVFRQEVFLHSPQDQDFYECGSTENDLGGLSGALWS